MRKIIICLSVTLLMLAGCRSKAPVYYGDAEVIEIPENVTESIFDIADNYRYVPLNVDDNPAAALGTISKVRVFLDKIYVMDNITTHKLLIFDKDGTFVGRVGRQGRGPREYLYLTTFEIDKHREEILVKDNSSTKIMVFDLDGGYKRTFDSSVWVEGMAVMPSGNIAYGILGSTVSNPDIAPYKLVVCDSENNILEKHLDYDIQYPFTFSSLTFLNPGYDGSVTFAPQLMNEVFRVSDDGVEHIYTINFTDKLDRELPAEINSINDFHKSRFALKTIFTGNHADSEDHFCFSYEHNKRDHVGYYNKKTSLTTVSDDRLCAQGLTFDEEGNVWGTLSEARLFFYEPKCEKSAELRDELVAAIQKSGNPIVVTYTLK